VPNYFPGVQERVTITTYNDAMGNIGTWNWKFVKHWHNYKVVSINEFSIFHALLFSPFPLSSISPPLLFYTVT
jgi:hypothetical protein